MYSFWSKAKYKTIIITKDYLSHNMRWLRNYASKVEAYQNKYLSTSKSELNYQDSPCLMLLACFGSK